MKRIFLIMLCGSMVLNMTGCVKKNNGNESKSQENYEGCCEGCMCGDTINLLKTTETAWMLTNVNSKGEYESTKDAFINFHGTGKNKFAFFENDNEVKGKNQLETKKK